MDRVNIMLSDAVNYCFFDMSESERALMIVNLRTVHKDILDDITNLMESGVPEALLRRTIVDFIIEARISIEAPMFKNFTF